MEMVLIFCMHCSAGALWLGAGGWQAGIRWVGMALIFVCSAVHVPSGWRLVGRHQVNGNVADLLYALQRRCPMGGGWRLAGRHQVDGNGTDFCVHCSARAQRLEAGGEASGEWKWC